MTYDSTADTKRHIRRVRRLLRECIGDLKQRAIDHDRSKLEEPEKSVFDRVTPQLAGSTYGSEEYSAFLADMKPALDHHYAENDHHPEHFADGIHGMDLIQLLEMVCDWKAASERHANGDILRSIEINAKRFGYSPELEGVLRRTAERLADA